MRNTRALRHTLYAVLIAIVAVCIILACVLFGAPALVTHALTEEHIAAFGEPDSGDTSTNEGRHPSGTPLTASSFESGGTYYEGELGTGSYYLTEDIVLHNNIKINGDVNLCLNGHMITGTGTNTVITVKANHKLTLFDCMEGDEGHAHDYYVGDNGVYEFGSGTNLIYGGVITGGNSHAGGGVNVEDGAGFVMYGGTIAGNTVTRDSDDAGDYPGRGGGVYAGGTFEMNGGAISYMNGGAISYNTAAIGGGVSVRENVTFTMTKGEISHNTAVFVSGASDHQSGIGGGVNVGAGTFEMSGGSIMYNTAIRNDDESSTGRGGGVYIYQNSSFNFSGGVIAGNSAYDGGGIFLYASSSKFSTNGADNSQGAGVLANNYAAHNGGGIYINDGSGNGNDYMIDGLTVGGAASQVVADGADNTSQINLDVVIDPTASETADPSELAFMKTSGGNYALSYGGGIYINRSHFPELIIDNGTISYNHAMTGAGIYVHAGGDEKDGSAGSLVLGTGPSSEVTITNNSALYFDGRDNEKNNGYGGGVFMKSNIVDGGTSYYSNIDMSGIITITENNSRPNGREETAKDNLYLEEGVIINAHSNNRDKVDNSKDTDCALNSGSQIGVTLAARDDSYWDENSFINYSSGSTEDALKGIFTSDVGGETNITVDTNGEITSGLFSYRIAYSFNTTSAHYKNYSGQTVTASGTTCTVSDNALHVECRQREFTFTVSAPDASDYVYILLNDHTRVEPDAVAENGEATFTVDYADYRAAANVVGGSETGIKLVYTSKEASVEYDGTTTYYMTVEEAFDYANNDCDTSEEKPATVTLLTDAQTESTLTVDTNDYITLDLDGHVLELVKPSDVSTNLENYSVITVNGNFTLTDSNKASLSHTLTIDGTEVIFEGGVITGGYSFSGGGVYVAADATFTMNGGTIAGNTAVRADDGSTGNAGRGGGVYAGGTFEMNGGAISYNMNGGAISYNTAAIGGGVSVRENVTFTMTKGEISYNSAVYAEGTGTIDAQESSIGGGVNVGQGTFKMEGGTIAFNSAISSASNTSRGGGVYVYTDSSFTMSGGEIYGNTASENGGGVYVYGGGSFTMSGGKIGGSEEHANKAASGAGVAISGQFSMTGGEISYNAATNQGGGVYVTLGTATGAGREVTNGLFTMSGGTISHNSANVGGGVYIWTGATFTMIAGDNGNGGTISNNSANEYGGGVYAYDFSMSAGTISNNKVESTTSLTAKGGGVYAATSFEMTGGTISGNEAEEGGGVYAGYTATMSGGEISGNSATRGGGIYVGYSLAMSGGTISGNEATDGAGIYTAYDLTVSDNAEIYNNDATQNGGGVYTAYGLTIDGGTISGNEAVNGGGIYAANSFTISGGTITSNEATNGGGVYAANGLTMSAGTISANVATNGGGVYTAGGTFTMTGGTIGGEADADGNAALMGGGIYIDGGAFSISNSASIMSNSAHDGAGVYVTDGSFTMTGGVISNNDASVASVEDDDTTARGGGVYINNGTFTMSGGKIGGDESGNRNWVTTGGYGGAVYLAGGSGASTISGTAEIAGNQATMGYGGGIYLASGTLNITGGTIGGTSSNDKNDVGLNGGGIYVADGTLNMSGGTITGNTANNGAGVYFAGDTFTMSGTALISANKGSVITGSGFGVYLASGTFTMSGGTISKNTISDHRGTSGGGVYVGGGEFKMVADENGAYGTISENVATFGGGVHVASGGKFTMSAGVISANRGQEYSNYGANYGGGVYVNGGTVEMTGGTISDNTALSAGGGVYVASGTFTMSGEASICDNEITSWTGAGGGVGIAGGTFNITGGSITGNISVNGGGGVGISGGTFNAENATISGNQALMGGGVYMNGGGVYVESGTGTVNFNSGTITKNSANAGGGVCVMSGAFTMTDGKITENNTLDSWPSIGGGVYMNGGSFTMNGGEISSNSSVDVGGGVFVGGGDIMTTNDGTLNLNGGSITGNTATNSYGGVYMSVDTTININGNPTVTGNTANGEASNIYLCEGVIINGSDSTTNNISSGTNSIGITLADDYTGDEGVFAYSANSNAAAFTSDQGGTVELKTDTTYGYRIYYTATVEIYTGNTLSSTGGTITGDVGTSDNTTYLKVYHGVGATFTPDPKTGYRYESAEFDGTKLTNYTVSYKDYTDATNKTLKVTFVVGTFDVTFTNTGNATFTGSDTKTYTYGTEVSIGAPSLDGYTFLGWQVNGGDYEDYVNGYTINSATVDGLAEGVTTITLTAKWNLVKPSGITASAISGTYTGSAFTTTATATHAASGATIGYTYSWTKQDSDFTASGATLSATNVADSGTYTVKATVTNYSGTIEIENGEKLGELYTTETVAVTISPAEVTIPSAATNLVYNGGEQTGVADGDHYGVSGNVQTNAGEYTATATLDDKANYVWAGTNNSNADQTIEWSIAKLSLNDATITLNSTSLVYNGATQTVSVTGVTVGTLNPAAGDYTVAGNSGKDAAKYTLTITAKDSSTNYTGTASTTWEITAKEISEIVWSSASPYTYNGGAQAPTLGSNTWLCENDNITAILQTAISGNNLENGEAVNVGSYTITASLNSGVTNYKFAESVTNASCNFEIAAKELTAVWYVDGTQAGGYASSQTYKGSAFDVAATADTGISGETVIVNVDGPADGAVNASDTAYTFTASVNGNSNYVISEDSKTFSLTINKLEIEEISWTYTNGDVAGGASQALTVAGGSATLTYNGSEYALAATFAGVGADGNIALTVTNGKFTAANSYTVSAAIPDKYSGNYVLAEGVGSISVTVSQGTASVSAKTYNGETEATAFVYGDSITVKGSVANGVGGTITVKAGDVELGKTTVSADGTFEVTYATSAKSIKPNSSIALTISFGGNDNLGSVTATANISLTAKQVTAQVTNAISKEYDGNADVTSLALSVAESDLVNSGDNVIVSGTAVYNDKNAGTDKTVTVTVTGTSGTDAAFYNVSAPTDVKGEITKATITVTSSTVTGRDYEVGNTSVEVTVTGTSGIIGEDSVTVTAKGEMTDANAGTNKAVNITYSLSGADAANYQLASETASGTVTIDKINPDYEAPTGLTATYGDTLAKVTLPTGWTWNSPETSVGNVGSHTFAATFTPEDTTNYNAVSVDLSVTVGKAKVTIEWTEPDYTYNGTDKTPEAVVVGKLGNDDLDVSVSITANSTVVSEAINAGTYTATATLTGMAAGNYEIIGSADKTFTITAMSIAAVWSVDGTQVSSASHSVTYKGAEFAVTATATGVGGTSVAVNVTAPAGGAVNASENSYTFTASITDTNYTLTNTTFSLTINKAVIPTGAFSVDGTYTYTGQEIKPVYTANDSVFGDDSTLADAFGEWILGGGPAVSYSNNINAGTATMTLTLLDDCNFTFADGSKTLTLNFTINKATLTDNTQGVTAEYDGKAHGLDISLSGFVNGETQTGADGYTVEYSTDGSSWSATPVTVTNVDDSKTVYYRVSYDNYNTVNGNKQIKITAKEITPSWSYTANSGSAVSINGSASVSFGYTYSVSAAADEGNGVVSGESVTFSYTVSGSGNAASLTAIGSYTITASLPAGSNYKIAEDAESVTFTIVTATTGYGSISFTTLPADNKIIYGDSFTVKAEYAAGIDQNITDGAIRYTVTSGGDCAEIDETTGALTAKAAGTVTIQATWSKDGYADLIATATITITVRQVTIEWSEGGTAISDNSHAITYDGATHTVSAEYDNAIEADIASAFTLTANGMKDAGTYTATVSLASGWDNRYSLSGDTLTYTINKAALTVSAGVDGEVAYGTAPENVTYTINYSGFVGTDTANTVFGTLPTASSGYSATTLAGTKVTITITVTEPENCNYTITNKGGSFIVAKASLDVSQLAVTANNAVYDGNAKTATVTAGSLEGVGTITVLYSSAANTYTAAEPKNAGTYYVFVTVAEGDNYYGVTEAYTGKSFTISRATVAIPEAAEGLVYNGSEQTGVAGGELYTVTGGSATNAYGYTATVSLKDSANYVWADNTDADRNIAWSIAPKIISAGDISWTYVNGDVAGGASQALTVSNGSATLTYNGSEYALAATFAGEGADGRIALDVAGGTFTNKGSYPVSAAMPEEYSGNYVLAEGAGSITADVAEGVASVSAATYSGNELTAEFVYGDVITVSGAVVNGAGGSITVMAGEVELGKTTVSADGTYEVTYNTASKGILPGEVTLNISFGGNSNLSAAQTSVDISLDKKQVTAYVSGDIAKVYDGSAAAAVTLAVAEGDLVNAGDELTVSGTAAYSDINAGLEKAVAVTLTAIGGADAAFYEVVAPANVTGDITKVTLLDGTAAVEAVYDGKAHALEIVLSGFVNGEMQTGAAGYAVEYSSDGKTWQSNPIAVTDVINSGTVYYRVSYTNYEIVEGSADITITPFVLFGEDIVWYSANEKIAEGERQLISGGLVYNGAAHVITAEIAGVGEMLELVVENDVIFAVPEGGTHSAAAALAEGVTNYVFDEASLTEILIAVSNAELIVEVQPYTGVYDGAAHAAFVGYSAVTADGTQPVWQFSIDGVQYSSEMPEFTEAGTYTVYYSVSADYHDAISGEAEVVISPASLYELSISGGYFEYNGLPHTVRVTVTDSNGNVIPSENYRVTYFGNVHAGTASVRVTGTGNYSGTLTGRFAITARRVAAEWQLPAGALGSDGSYSAAFGGSFTLSASAELGIDGESAVITYLINGRPAESVNITEAGTYTITAVLSEVIGGIASDYTLTNSAVTVSLIDASGDGGHSPIFAYEDPENLVYDGTRKEAEVTPIGIYSGYDAIVYYSSTEDKITSAEPVDVGTYYVFASVNIGGEQAFEPVLVGEFTIVKAVVAIPEFNGKIYADGELNAVIPDGFNSDIMDIEGNTFVDGGDYTATVTLKDTHNYEWEDGTTSEKELSFHVEPLICLIWLIILLLIILIIEIIVAIVLGRRIKRYREQLEGDAEGADGAGGAGKQNMLAAAPIGLFGINAPVWQIVAVMVLGAAVIVMAIVDIALGVKCGKLKRELEAKLQAGAEQPSDGGKAE